MEKDNWGTLPLVQVGQCMPINVDGVNLMSVKEVDVGRAFPGIRGTPTGESHQDTHDTTSLKKMGHAF